MRVYNLDLLDRTDYGGFWQRAAATAIDSLILYLPWHALAAFLGVWLHGSFQWRQSEGIEVAANVIVWGIYATYFWTSDARATPGKRIMKLVVVTDDGFALSAGKSLWRVAMMFVSGLFIIGPLLAVFTQRRQALHDFLAGTVVVKENAAHRVKLAGFQETRGDGE